MSAKKYITPWYRRLFLKRISVPVILVTMTLSLALVGLTIYGSSVGNFVINIEQDTQAALSLSEDGDFIYNATTVLQANGLQNVTHATYRDVPDDIASYGGGAHNDLERRYFAYTFFLKNTAHFVEAYSLSVDIEEEYKDVGSALRVMIIQNGERSIFARLDSDGAVPDDLPSDYDRPYTPAPFVSASRVCQIINPVLQADEIVKYTVVMWLEGWDEDCVDRIKGGAIRMSMSFNVIG